MGERRFNGFPSRRRTGAQPSSYRSSASPFESQSRYSNQSSGSSLYVNRSRQSDLYAGSISHDTSSRNASRYGERASSSFSSGSRLDSARDSGLYRPDSRRATMGSSRSAIRRNLVSKYSVSLSSPAIDRRPDRRHDLRPPPRSYSKNTNDAGGGGYF